MCSTSPKSASNRSAAIDDFPMTRHPLQRPRVDFSDNLENFKVQNRAASHKAERGSPSKSSWLANSTVKWWRSFLRPRNVEDLSAISYFKYRRRKTRRGSR